MARFWQRILRAKVVSVSSLLSLAFVGSGWAWAQASLSRVANSPIILHWNDLDGITAVGAPKDLAVIGGIGIVVVFLNFFLALELEERDRFLGKLMAGITLIFATLLFIGFAAIISVN